MNNELKPAPDLVGRRYHNLTVKERYPEDYVIPSSGQTVPRWVCVCDCGNEKIIVQTSLSEKEYGVKSCGIKGCPCSKRSKKSLDNKAVTKDEAAVKPREPKLVPASTPRYLQDMDMPERPNFPDYKYPMNLILKVAKLENAPKSEQEAFLSNVDIKGFTSNCVNGGYLMDNIKLLYKDKKSYKEVAEELKIPATASPHWERVALKQLARPENLPFFVKT